MGQRCAFLAAIQLTRFSPNYLQTRFCTEEIKSTAMDDLCGFSFRPFLCQTHDLGSALGSTRLVAMRTSPIPQLLRWATLTLPTRTLSLLGPIHFLCSREKGGRLFAVHFLIS